MSLTTFLYAAVPLHLQEADNVAFPLTPRWFRISEALKQFGYEGKLDHVPSERDLAPHLITNHPERYSLWEHRGKGNTWGMHRSDAKYAFFLAGEMPHVVEPLAIVSFRPAHEYTGAVLIRQLQSLPHKQEKFPGDHLRGLSDEGYALLRAVQWERTLINVVEEWARDAGFKQAHILPANQNAYYGTDETLNRRLKKRYDMTARWCGYNEPDKKIDNFWKKI